MQRVGFAAQARVGLLDLAGVDGVDARLQSADVGVSDRRNQATSESAYSGHLSAVSGRQHSRHTPASAESA
jgi:hypothetical protein